MTARRRLTARAILGVALPLLLVAGLHYGAPMHAHWVHDLARRLFYVPIVLGAVLGGLRGGVLVAVLVWAVYFPHAFLPAFGMDPSSGSEKALEMGFYLVLGAVSGGVVDRLAAMDARLQRAARLESLGQLSAGLAHEIKNPLHAMRGTAEIVLDAVPAGTEEAQMGRALLQEIDRLDGVLKRFLDYARPGAVALVPADLCTLAGQVATLLRAQASRQGTALSVEVPPAEVPALVAPDQVVQVALGIGLNALQSLGQGGALRLTVLSGPPSLRIENDGPPIPSELIERIFDPFVSGRPGGTGLGLSTAWALTEAMGASISAQNLQGGQGVAFTLRFRPG